MFALVLTVLCLMSVGYADPNCTELVQPFVDVDPESMMGQWALVAHSANLSSTTSNIEGKDSLTVFFRNGSYTLVPRTGDKCDYYQRETHMEGHTFHVHLEQANITGTIYRAECQDCAMMTIDVESPKVKRTDLYLFSRQREVEKEVLEKFDAQAECLHMPKPSAMDGKMELCPEEEVKADPPASA